MKNFIFIMCCVLLASACSENITNDKGVESSDNKEITNIEANQILNLDIEGMSCEMACGGSIRESLLKTGAVARVQFVDFEMGASTNSSKIYFDNSKISKEEIISIVSEINKNQFKVLNLSVEEMVQGASSSVSEGHNRSFEKGAPEVAITPIQLPNLLDLIRSLILN